MTRVSTETTALESGAVLRNPKPFLKWAGGKRQLLPQLRRFIPAGFAHYHEPFVGSGAVFFDLWTQRRLHDRKARLVDTNGDLIGCYRTLARDVESVVRHLGELARRHAANPAEHYYKVRNESFNPARTARFGSDAAGTYPPDLAAMLIYLNRTGFNGLYRLNSRGQFNVPAGRYSNPQICDADNLRAVAHALGSVAVDLVQGPYTSVLTTARCGDLVYFDPPYAPVSSTSTFTSYTAAGFSDDDQRELQQVVLQLASRGCYVILSNSTAPLISKLYETNLAARRAGLHAHRIPAKRAINSNPARRGSVMEFIVTNVQPIG